MNSDVPVQVVHVTGARPNFPKAAPVVRALGARGVRQRLIHTGQHYDERMSDVFFRQLGLPEPDENLAVGSGSHAGQTGEVMVGLERLFVASRPGLVVVYGDVNSTLAAALVATKLGIPVAHVEAGLRSFNRSMPEEINRLVTDRVSELLFATSPDALVHLGNEGVDPARVHFVGNPMIDTLLANLHLFDVPLVRQQLSLPERYVVATLHRPANVDDPGDAAELTKALHTVADQVLIVLPLHPRGRASLAAAGLFPHPRIRVVEPQGYVEFLSLVRGPRRGHRLRRCPGGDDGAGRTVPHPARRDRASRDHQPRHEPPGDPGGVGGGGPGAAGDATARRGLADTATVGRSGRQPDSRGDRPVRRRGLRAGTTAADETFSSSTY